jgi:hypothetical protein
MIENNVTLTVETRTTVMSFGNADIGVGRKSSKEAESVIFKNVSGGNYEIGEDVMLRGVPDVEMRFTSVESIDVVIDELLSAKQELEAKRFNALRAVYKRYGFAFTSPYSVINKLWFE